GAPRLRGQRSRRPPRPSLAPVGASARVTSPAGVGGARVRIEGVHKAFGLDGRSTPALIDVSLEVQAGELLCLLGPSGCGKSTLLNIVAGFIPPTRGRVRVDGAPIAGPGPERGVVFQEYALFPWLTVAQNVEFGPRLMGVPASRRREVVARYLDMVGLSEHATKFPVQL